MLATDPYADNAESSWASSFTSAVSSFFTVSADEDKEDKEDKEESKDKGDSEEKKDSDGEDSDEEAAPAEEEEEEPEDPKPIIEEECADTQACAPFKHHLEACNQRVESGESEHENCVEELFHLMHCVDKCMAPKLFSQLK